MGSTSRRGDGLPFFESKTPHFFKIILDDVLRLGKLEIPRNFMERYGSSIPNSVCLKVPSGESWPVEMSKNGNGGWFQNGWQEFVEYYSLDYGHLLVFEHDGGSSFNVLIFDMSATEIRYPTICVKEPKRAGEQMELVEERAEDDAIKGLSIGRRARKRSSLPFPCRHKKARNDLTSQGNNTLKPLPNFRKIDSASKIPEEFGGVQPYCLREKSEALPSASNFRSEHPNFTVVMTKSYVSSYLAIPAEFCTTYIGIKQSDVSLCVSDGRVWSAKYKNLEKNSSGRLISGWNIFVRDNCLRVGDVCVFELLDMYKIKLRVSIFRVDENLNIDPLLGENVATYVEGGAPLIFDSTDQIFDLSLGRKKTRENGKGKKTTYENVEALLRTNAFKSINPYFSVTLKRSHIDNGVELIIPAEFAKKHLTEKQSGVAFFVCNGRTWPVLYKQKPDRSCFYTGWKQFVRGNGLKDGDGCFFELIAVNKITFKVSIFRANGSMSKHAGEQVKPVEGRAEDDDSCKIINGFSSSHRGRKRSSLPCPRRHKKARNDLTSKKESTATLLPNFRKIDSANKIPEDFGGVQPSCQMEKSEALQRVNSFRSEHPNFMMVMSKSYVYRRDGYLAIPAKFCKTFIGKEQCDVSLCVSDGRNWSVKYKHHANQSSGRLISGWKTFVRENRLQVDDKCIFELIDLSEIKLRVSIFRADENPNIDHSLGENIPAYVEGGAPLIYDSTDQFFDLSLGGKKMCGNRKGKNKTCENVEALLRANDFKSVHPYFPVTLKPSYIDRVGLAIPARFARKHLTKNHSGVTLSVPYGRTWLVQYRRNPNRSRFYHGWKEFVKDNGLKAGDHCVFELIEVNEITFKVSIFKGNGSMSTLSE